MNIKDLAPLLGVDAYKENIQLLKFETTGRGIYVFAVKVIPEKPEPEKQTEETAGGFA